MTDKNVALFIDTNCFLQMKDFNQIAWRKLFPEAEAIKLFVCSAVITELDKHKVSANQRRRNRARKALAQIEEAAATNDMTLLIREAAPKVEIAIWRGKPVWSDFSELDPYSADDYLVAAAATDACGIVLSHDTGPRIRARIAGVRAECPPEEWLLPAEQTDDQRKITQLNRELEAAQNARPRLQIIMPPDEPITIEAAAVPFLGSVMVKKLTGRVLEEFPRAHIEPKRYLNNISILSDPYHISQSRIDAYHDEYQTFVSSVETYFTVLHERIERHSLAQMPSGSVANIGNVSAKNLTLVLRAVGEIELLADREDAESLYGPVSLPDPPKPPRGGYIFDAPRHLSMPTHRNPTGFYWIKRPTIGAPEMASFECADFRPAREEHFGVLVCAIGELPSKGELIVNVSAEHHEVVSERRTIMFERKLTHWLDPVVQQILPEVVRDAFNAVDEAELPVF
ncbi:PIN domain-containing protein [Novosphingobium sp. ES2-1]|uniref:PIN domain-containing protein n=1 Tax=Novosphingobium sp. ES2-1 TaxID=2780074 RepID=UPI001881CCB2|nr:PIN domain-containing protein [Novosphingobium sp. ES2-1]QOV94795.1 hypothetical protein IM701_04925 [Novosphingobium sp. ES2-1]